jgi:hypothetical protein
MPADERLRGRRRSDDEPQKVGARKRSHAEAPKAIVWAEAWRVRRDIRFVFARGGRLVGHSCFPLRAAWRAECAPLVASKREHELRKQFADAVLGQCVRLFSGFEVDLA